MKKIGIYFMALCLAFAPTALFAEDVTVEDQTTSVGAAEKQDTAVEGVEVTATSATVGADININMPTSFTYILNPYKLEDQAQIISPELSITNYGNTDISVMLNTVGVEITAGAAGGTPTLASAPVSATSTKKEMFLHFSIKDDLGEYPTFDAKANAGLILKTSGFKAVELKKLARSANPEGGEAGGTAVVKLSGSMSTNAVWDDGDSIIIKPVFKFIPCVIE